MWVRPKKHSRETLVCVLCLCVRVCMCVCVCARACVRVCSPLKTLALINYSLCKSYGVYARIECPVDGGVTKNRHLDGGLDARRPAARPRQPRPSLSGTPGTPGTLPSSMPPFHRGGGRNNCRLTRGSGPTNNWRPAATGRSS